MKILKYAVSLGILLAFGTAQAGVPQAQVDRLGKDLTPTGGEKAANKDGSIPAWTGGITTPPAGYKNGEHHRDPFAADKALFVVDSTNVQTYKEKLSPGQLALFSKYQTYKMPVYPTRRSCAFSPRVDEMSRKNALTGKLVGGGDGVEDVAEGIPFPIPQNGQEVVWNHKLKYKGLAAKRYND